MDIETLKYCYGVMYYQAKEYGLGADAKHPFLFGLMSVINKTRRLTSLCKTIAGSDKADAATRKLAQQYLDDLNAL